MKMTAAVGLMVGALVAGPGQVQAQNVAILDMVFQPGANLFGVPLQVSGNVLSSVFGTVPEGTTVALWDPTISTSGAYYITSTNLGGVWSADLTIPVGMGALLTLPGTATITNQIVGEVLTGDGISTPPGAGIPDMIPPTAQSGVGNFLLSSITPFDLPLDPSGPHGTTNSVWNWVVGRDPIEGEQFRSLDAASQSYFTTLFQGGNWNNGVPTLAVGQAAFFTLNIPEPSAAALFGLAGSAVLLLRRRR